MSPRPGFLLDEHISLAAAEGLRRRDLDALHICEASLSGAPDERIMEAATELQRLLVTRDIGDFSRLARIYLRFHRSFPGILLVSPSIPEEDPGVLIDAVLKWTSRYGELDQIAGGIAWLPVSDRQDGDQQVRETRPRYMRALERIGATI